MASVPELYTAVASVFQPNALARGAFEGGGPIGVTLHVTGERNLHRVETKAVSRGEGYHVVIDRLGNIHQTAFFTQKVNHAGKAQWLNHSPNRSHLAVALLSWGRLVPGPKGTWLSATGNVVRSSDVALRPGNLTAGNHQWDACTIAQEAALKELLAWLVGCGLHPSHICGIEECALPPGRSESPGGTLSFSLRQLREDLRFAAAK